MGDRTAADIPPPLLEREVVRVSVTSVELDGVVEHVERDARGHRLRESGLPFHILAVVVPGERSKHVQPDRIQ